MVHTGAHTGGRSKKKNRSGCPSMYITDTLRKKSYSALPKLTVSTIGVVSVLVDGLVFMGTMHPRPSRSAQPLK